MDNMFENNTAKKSIWSYKLLRWFGFLYACFIPLSLSILPVERDQRYEIG